MIILFILLYVFMCVFVVGISGSLA